MEFDTSSEVITVLSSGYYMVSGSAVKLIPTGEYETIPNPYRKWFHFWKPKTITRMKFDQEKVSEGKQLVYLNKGDVVQHDLMEGAYRL